MTCNNDIRRIYINFKGEIFLLHAKNNSLLLGLKQTYIQASINIYDLPIGICELF